jgi:hypothetical protein
VRPLARVIAILLGAFYLAFGAWAFLDPASFAESIASFPPYNGHLLKDLGAFQFGLGVGLIAAVTWADGVRATFLGVAAASVLHAVSHIQDRHLGGRASDPYTVGLIALLALAGFGLLGAQRRKSGASCPLTYDITRIEETNRMIACFTMRCRAGPRTQSCSLPTPRLTSSAPRRSAEPAPHVTNVSPAHYRDESPGESGAASCSHMAS